MDCHAAAVVQRTNLEYADGRTATRTAGARKKLRGASSGLQRRIQFRWEMAGAWVAILAGLTLERPRREIAGGPSAPGSGQGGLHQSRRPHGIDRFRRSHRPIVESRDGTA